MRHSALPRKERCQLLCFMGLCGPHDWSVVYTIYPLPSPSRDDGGNGVPTALCSADHGNDG